VALGCCCVGVWGAWSSPWVGVRRGHTPRPCASPVTHLTHTWARRAGIDPGRRAQIRNPDRLSGSEEPLGPLADGRLDRSLEGLGGPGEVAVDLQLAARDLERALEVEPHRPGGEAAGITVPLLVEVADLAAVLLLETGDHALHAALRLLLREAVRDRHRHLRHVFAPCLGWSRPDCLQRLYRMTRHSWVIAG